MRSKCCSNISNRSSVNGGRREDGNPSAKFERKNISFVTIIKKSGAVGRAIARWRFAGEITEGLDRQTPEDDNFGCQWRRQ
ncbi:MAG: hypothetical protein HC849_05970 [Oscillatoriales cyanobacterium RU_3_3]|nr:hypothetical protein [Microcoleus sp. SU_5_3]NJM59839.1 hypothetical protein [Oscillatoriales cyanobacterium RU_3_3]NJR21172.1 hypothetical protein [Richelia sp. CSU_2_1]